VMTGESRTIASELESGVWVNELKELKAMN